MTSDRTPAPTRRRVLAALGAAGTVGVIGCLDRDEGDGGAGSDGGESTGTFTPVEDSRYDLSVEHPPIEEWDGYAPDWEPPEGSPLETEIEVEVLVENLEIPWDLSFSADGDLFLTERPGRVARYDGDRLRAITEPADVIDHATAVDPDGEGGWWEAGGEGGLLGSALHPNFPDVPVLYAYYTYDAGDGGEDLRNRLVYYDVTEDDPEETVVIEGIPGANVHNGARLAFGPRNYLWVTMGDAEDGEHAADPSTLAGTIFRITPTGAPAPDNPEIEGGDPRVYSYGHRNPQGIDWLPDGTPIVTEHGPAGRGEVMLPRPGGDHGWPTVRGAPDDDEYEAYADREDVVPPVINTGPTTTWAPSGGVFYRGDAVPGWRNRFLVGGLASQQLHVVTPYPSGEAPDPADGTLYADDWLDDRYDAAAHQALTDELGRIRHVEQGPDGTLYAVTSNRDGRAADPFPAEGDDVLVRLQPA